MVSNVESGPDGNRLFAAALKSLEMGDSGKALRILFDLFRVEPLHSEGLKTAARLSSAFGSSREAELFLGVAEDPRDPQFLFELGYVFVDLGFPGVGANYLAACSHERPEDHRVRQELAYALFRGGDYRAATEILKPLAANQQLGGPEKFAARLLLVESLVHAGETARAQRIFELLDPGDGDSHAETQLDALASLLARAALLGGGSDRGPRGWHFIEHGGVVLHIPRDDPFTLPLGTVGVDFLAGMLRRLAGLLAALDMTPFVVQALSPASAPLASGFAGIVGAEVEPCSGDSPGKTLIMSCNLAEAEPHLKELRNHEEGVDLFTLSVDPRIESSLAPEIIGQFAAGLAPPSENGKTEILDQLVAALSRPQEDRTDIHTLIDYYMPLKGMLILGNHDANPARRVLTPWHVH
ncbi:MAG: hypothetical protein V2A76_17650 [Planctomycetota bacterium]